MSRPRISAIHYWATLVVSAVGLSATAPVTNAGFSASQTGQAVITIVIPKDSVAERNKDLDPPIHREAAPEPPTPVAGDKLVVPAPTQEPEKNLPTPTFPEEVATEQLHPTEAAPHQEEESTTHEGSS